MPCAVPKDEDFCLSKAVSEIIKPVESRRSSLEEKSLHLWVPHTAEFISLKDKKNLRH